MHPVDKREQLLQRKGGGRLIGNQHHFLDQALRFALHTRLNIGSAPLFVNKNLCLCRGKVERSAFSAPGRKNSGELPQEGQFVEDLPVFVKQRLIALPLKNPVDLAVNALDPRADYAFFKAEFPDFPLLIQRNKGRKSKPVLLRIKGAGAVGKGGRKHRNNRVGIIDRSTPGKCRLVKQAFRCDIIADISNMHPQLPAACGAFDRNRIVDILGIGSVDGKNRDTAQVEPARHLFFHRLRSRLLRLVQHPGGEFPLNPGRIEDCTAAVFRKLRCTETALHHRTAVPVAVAMLNQKRYHFFPLRGGGLLSFEIDRNEGGIVRDKFQLTVFASDHSAGKTIFRPLNDREDLSRIEFPFRTAHPDHHPVSGQRSHQLTPRDKNILLCIVDPRKAKGLFYLDDGRGLCADTACQNHFVVLLAHQFPLFGHFREQDAEFLLL